MLRYIVTAGLLLAAPATAIADHRPGHKTATFTVRIENVSAPSTLKLSNGTTAPAPNSPGLWVVSSGKSPLFKSGKRDIGKGLEAQAEDGNPTMLAKSLAGMKDVVASGVFNVPVGDAEPGPALPGKSYQFILRAAPGDRLHLTTMFGQSNDLFYAPGESGIALFDAKGAPVQGDVTSRLSLWDAGTERNQEPGFGSDQAPRQKAPNTGAAEKKPVALVKDSFTYPPVTSVLRVTITPSPSVAIN